MRGKLWAAYQQNKAKQHKKPFPTSSNKTTDSKKSGKGHCKTIPGRWSWSFSMFVSGEMCPRTIEPSRMADRQTKVGSPQTDRTASQDQTGTLDRDTYTHTNRHTAKQRESDSFESRSFRKWTKLTTEPDLKPQDLSGLCRSRQRVILLVAERWVFVCVPFIFNVLFRTLPSRPGALLKSRAKDGRYFRFGQKSEAPSTVSCPGVVRFGLVSVFQFARCLISDRAFGRKGLRSGDCGRKV